MEEFDFRGLADEIASDREERLSRLTEEMELGVTAVEADTRRLEREISQLLYDIEASNIK